MPRKTEQFRHSLTDAVAKERCTDALKHYSMKYPQFPITAEGGGPVTWANPTQCKFMVTFAPMLKIKALLTLVPHGAILEVVHPDLKWIRGGDAKISEYIADAKCEIEKWLA